MHLEGDITSFVGCKATILPNLQAPTALANPSSRRRFGARGRHFDRPGALAPVLPLPLDPRLTPPYQVTPETLPQKLET